MIRIACLLIALQSSGLVEAADRAADVASSKAVAIPDSVRVESDVAYLGGDRKQKADLYFPRNLAPDARLPALIVIHGGGFNDGDKAKRRELNIATNAVMHGYIAMSINYRLWFKGATKPTWPQSVLDAKTAVRWLRANADRLHIDASHIGAMGCSAGGNLVTMLGLTRPQDGFEPETLKDQSSAVQCVVDFYGPVDLPHYHDMKMFLKTRAEAPELYLKASPISYAHKDAPPILIVHGTADQTVNVSQSHTLAAKLRAVGAQHELVIVEGATHTFDLESGPRDLRPLVFEFLDKHLKSAK